MKRYLTLSMLLLLLFIGCANREEMQETESTTAASELSANLKIPWNIAKEEETFYITEREGAIVKIEDGETERQAVAFEQVISEEAETGLLGFVLTPDFSISQQAIAYYTYKGEAGPENRIVRLEMTGDTWIEREVLLDNIPSGPIHHGGRLAIGPDEKLYATTGDAATPELAQDLDSLAGKILRLNLDGTIPEDNPFEASYIYSHGHRNPQGLTWTKDGKMFASEHGNQANDEINGIEPGKNYGWPEIEGLEEAENMQVPAYTSGTEETWAPSGMDAYNEKLYVATLRGNAIIEIHLKSNKTRQLFTDYGRIRDIYIEEDTLYFITNNTDGRGEPIESDDRLMQVDLAEFESE